MDKKQEYVAPEMTILDVELEASILTASDPYKIGFCSDDWDNENDYQY